MKEKIHQLFSVKRQENREIGIEIEIEGPNLKNPIRSFWTCHQDGSLRGPSVEYVLKAPVPREKTKQRLNFLKTELLQNGAIIVPSDRAGVHIHVNCQDLTTTQVINFAIVYLILEDMLVEMCGEDRIGNLFCLRATDADRIISGLRQSKEHNDLNIMQNRNYRYVSINMSALSKFGSVEFRAFKTPKDLMQIQPWIDILLRIKDYSLGFNEGYDIIENISFGGPENFVNNVLGNKASLLKVDNRQHLILEGVRRVQEIAYIVPIKKSKSIEGPETIAWGNPRMDMEAPEPPADVEMPERPIRRQRPRYHLDADGRPELIGEREEDN